MKIAEIFHSVQGEGGLVGVPSVFIRLSGCNLRCTWCDTPYTSWLPEGVEMSQEDVLQTTDGFRCTHAVVTGGEPMMFPAVVPLTAETVVREPPACGRTESVTPCSVQVFRCSASGLRLEIQDRSRSEQST